MNRSCYGARRGLTSCFDQLEKKRVVEMQAKKVLMDMRLSSQQPQKRQMVQPGEDPYAAIIDKRIPPPAVLVGSSAAGVQVPGNLLAAMQ